MLHHGKERLFQFGRSDRKGTIGIKILVLIWIILKTNNLRQCQIRLEPRRRITLWSKLNLP